MAVAVQRSDELEPVPGSDIMRASWVPVRGVPAEALAFDHADMLRVAVNRVQSKLRYSWIAFQLLPEVFTLPELRYPFSFKTNIYYLYPALYGLALSACYFVPGWVYYRRRRGRSAAAGL